VAFIVFAAGSECFHDIQKFLARVISVAFMLRAAASVKQAT
jgi:hypothetical protein